MKRTLQTLCSVVALSLPGSASGFIMSGHEPLYPLRDHTPSVSLPIECTVQPGDTLWGIAKKVCDKGARYENLATYNGISNPNRIPSGQILRVPPEACYSDMEFNFILKNNIWPEGESGSGSTRGIYL